MPGPVLDIEIKKMNSKDIGPVLKILMKRLGKHARIGTHSQ